MQIDTEEALKSGVYCSGTTGSGKSDVGMYIAEQLMREGVIVIVFDPSQDWMDRSSIPEVRYQTTEMPQSSVIYDMSKLNISEQQTTVEEFCQRLMKAQIDTVREERRQYFLIFEEAHIYFPEGAMRAKRYQNTVFMMTNGRNYKVRFMAITQFASLLDKRCMKYMRQRFFGYTDEPNDIKYVAKFFEDKPNLRGLQAGTFLYKNGDVTQKVAIEPFESRVKPSAQMGFTAQALLPEPKAMPSNDGALLKLLAFGAIGGIILWLLLGAM